MKSKPLKVLIVGGGSKAPDLLQNEDTEARSFEFCRVSVGRLAEKLADLRDGGPHLILLDFNLSEADLMKALSRIRESGREIPVLVLPREIDSCSLVNASFRGTMGTRYGSRVEKDSMAQSLHDALRRKAFQEELSRLALSDELTGLYNRRGFLIHGSEYMKRASRLKQHLLVFYADLDNLKQINDQFGHEEGDRALIKIAEVFKKTFRNLRTSFRALGAMSSLHSWLTTSEMASIQSHAACVGIWMIWPRMSIITICRLALARPNISLSLA